MPKKKGGKLTKGARQNRREKMLVRKQSATLSPAAETVEEPARTAKSAETVAPAAAPTDKKLAATMEPEKTSATKKTAAAKKPDKKTATENKPKDTAVPTERKKPGPNPKTAEQKTEAPKRRKTLKNGASNETTTLYIQYKGKEDGVEDLIAAARADYKAAHKRTPINSIKLYVKPEEYMAYYVVNDSYFGKVKM